METQQILFEFGRMVVWIALGILGWLALTAIVHGIVIQGWAPYWRNVGSIFQRNPPFEEYGDLSEGR